MLKLIKWAALAAAATFAAPAASQTAKPPKLIVAIAVDQLSSDLFTAYRPHFTGGLARLSQGAVFPSGYQGHAATETCPGHSTILTGSRPSRTGVIANNWYDLTLQREDKQVYCSEDPRIPGSSSSKYTVSTHFLRVPAMGDLMKRATPQSRVAVVAGKDRAAVMMGGYKPDHRWWWSGKEFVADPATGQPARAGALVNASIAQALSRPRPPLPLPPLCEARSRPVVLSEAQTVGTGRFAREAGDSRSFRASPELDGATLAMAAVMQQEFQLGRGAAADLLVIGLSATDYVGHGYGTEGSEMCLQLLELDRSLGDFFKRLDSTGIDYAVVLTSDHGGHDLPERQRQQGRGEAQRVDQALFAETMGKAIGARLGVQGPVLYGESFGDIYIDRSLTAAQRAQVLEEAVRTYRAHPQVAAAFTSAQLKASPAPAGPPARWSLMERARASFDPERSGDLVVLLKSGITPIRSPGPGYVATHGSPWDYDRRVPILFWRKGMRPFEQPAAVETVDILPTLAPLIGLPIAAGSIDGRCLDLIEGPETSCR